METPFEPSGPLLPAPNEPPLLLWARAELGVHETPGPAATERIVWYHSHTTLRATSDEVAWCSAFVCAGVEAIGGLSTRSAAAKSWIDWGGPSTLVPGAVVVLFNTRAPVSITRSGFHVGILVALGASGRPILIGGNQNDSVSIAAFGPQWQIRAVRRAS